MTSRFKIECDLPSIRDDHEEKPSHSVPSFCIIFLLGFYMLLGFITSVIQNDMPSVINEKDVQKDDWSTFSEDSAMKYLYRILGDQARVSGSVYHFVKTRDLKWLLEEVTANSNLPVHIDWQYVSGNYWLEFDPPYVNSYNNVSNIIAVLEGESGVNENSIGTSVLVNCHYDSVPFAIGASDNGIFCAAMVEILDKLSRRKEKFKQNIIFLFNGAEENVLMGSHGFLKHPWSKNISSVINLDSAGMNGRPSVFQVTNPQILPHYSKTPRPTAQAVGQFLFQSGIIPSDTDFRIWRDFGNITGLDIAFTESGHVYHTRYDKPQMIQTGVVQHAGDMLITLIAGVAERRQGDEQDNSSPVYYDYLSLFLISYSERQSQIIDGVVAVLGLMSVVYYMWLFGLRWSVLRDLLCSLAGRLVCIVAGVLTVALLTLATILLDMGVARYMQLRYLSYKWLVVPFYWLPYFTSYILVSFLYDGHCNNKVNRSIKSLQAMTATRLLLSMLLLISVALPSLSKVRYVLTVIVLMTSLCSFITMTCVRRFRLTGVQHLLLQVFLSVPLSLFCFSLSLRLSPFLSSILGRSGSNYPDVMMAGVSVALAVVFGFGVSGIELLFSKSYMSRVLCSLLCVWLVLSLVPIPQYGGEVTQRHYWFHTKITTYNSSLAPIDVNSGVVIMKLDPYTVQSALTAIRESPFYSDNGQTNETFIKGIKIIDEECNDLVNCNLPSIRPRFDKFMRNSLFLKMEPPKEFNRSFNLVNKYCDETKCHMSFIMRGAAHNAITLYPYFNITAWSLEPEVKSTTTFKDRPLYVIYHACNTYVEFFEPFEFTITMEVPKTKQNESLIEISHHSHKIYNPEDFTENYIKLLNNMPEYFNIATFLSFRDNYIF